MMSWRLMSTHDAVPQPWRNGGGVTRELLAWPSVDAWQVRVSVADIAADGPFSAYPGVQRWFAVLEGAGVELGFEGAMPRRLAVGDAPLCFDGAATPSCRLLDGPTRDLNVMLRGAPGAMEKVRAGATWQPGLARCGLFAAAAGRCLHGEAAIDVPANCLLWFDIAPESLRFEPAAPHAPTPGWWISASPEEVERKPR